MTDYTGRHIAGFAEGFGLNSEHISSVYEVLSSHAGVLKDSIEIKLVDTGDIPGCGFTANISDIIDMDYILDRLRQSNQFSSVCGFQINPLNIAVSGLQASPNQFTITA